MRPEHYKAMLVSTLSDTNLLVAFALAKKTKSPDTKLFGLELIRRWHQKDPLHFTKEWLEKNVKMLEEKYPR